MARTLSQLKSECDKNGLTVVQSGRAAKTPYESALRNFYWKKEFGDREMPPQLHPMLARNAKDLTEAERDAMWASPRWVAQEKIDGCRLLMFLGNEGSAFTSRRISDRTYRYSENTDQLPHLKKVAIPDLALTVIDGEIQCRRHDVNTGAVVTKNVLQATVALLAIDPKESERIQREQDAWLVYRVFDILQYKGRDCTSSDYMTRRSLLRIVVDRIKLLYPGIHIEEVPVVAGAKKEFYEEVVKRGGEGIMLKDETGTYVASSSRPKTVYKVKRFEEFDLFVTGFVPADADKGWFQLIGGLEMSAYDTSAAGSTHVVAVPINLSLEDRIAATACIYCGTPVTAVSENIEGKRVVTSVLCSEVTCCKHGSEFTQTDVALNKEWINKVYVVRGQEFTARVYRLKHAVIISQRFDKAPEDCSIDVEAIRNKFDAKGVETGFVL